MTTADVYGPVGTGAGTGGTGASLGGTPATRVDADLPPQAPGAGLYTAGERGRVTPMATHDPVDARDRGLGELVKELAGQTSTLIRQEIQLAQAEVTQKGKLAGKGAGMLAGAGVTALLGLGALTALLIIALDGFLPLWLGALIVTLLWFAVAAALAVSGKTALQSAAPPYPRPLKP